MAKRSGNQLKITKPTISPPTPPDNENTRMNASVARKQATPASIELSGDRRNFSTYIDTAIAPYLDATRAQLLMMGVGQGMVSKTDVVEAALVMLLEDFQANGENSYLARYVNTM